MMRLAQPISSLLFICAVLASASTQAHYEKSSDRNGGHWDNSGYYHCHEPQCVEAPSRFQLRRLGSLSNRDEDLYYLQEDWPYWLEIAGCKTARTVVLENTSKVPVTWTNPRQCEIREGLWVDEYTGEEFTRAGQMEVDHIISPVYANASNGFQWDYNTRAQFANDPYNLIPVARETHRKKRQRSIGRWQPRTEFQCEYAQSWRDIAEKYDLDLFGQDKSRINKMLDSCDSDATQSVEE
jgi:hypothetical protein